MSGTDEPDRRSCRNEDGGERLPTKEHRRENTRRTRSSFAGETTDSRGMPVDMPQSSASEGEDPTQVLEGSERSTTQVSQTDPRRSTPSRRITSPDETQDSQAKAGEQTQRSRPDLEDATPPLRDEPSSETLKSKMIFDAAVRNYQRPVKGKCQILEAYRDGIGELRRKGASYATIARALTQAGVPVSHDTVARFCKTSLKEKPLRKQKRKSPSPSEDARPRGLLGLPLRDPNAPLSVSSKLRGPRIADPKNL